MSYVNWKRMPETLTVAVGVRSTTFVTCDGDDRLFQDRPVFKVAS